MPVKTLAGGSAAVVFLMVLIAAVVGTVAALGGYRPPMPSPTPGGGSTPSPAARADIPPDLLVLYQRAAGDCPGLDWSTLAAIGKVETDHGRSTLPGVSTGENFAGAGGLMQFEQSTFDAVIARHPLPAGGATPPSRYDASDAINAAAYYLCDSGAARDLHAAIFTYNHSDAYVNQVLGQAARYRLDTTSGSGDCRTIQAASTVAAQAISFACAQLGQPYVWGGNGPASGGWDCSGLVQAAYAHAGISLPRTTYDQVNVGPRIPESQLQPGDLIFYANRSDGVHHVALYLGAGKIVHAPDFGSPVQVSNYRYPGDDYYLATRPSERHSSCRSSCFLTSSHLFGVRLARRRRPQISPQVKDVQRQAWRRRIRSPLRHERRKCHFDEKNPCQSVEKHQRIPSSARAHMPSRTRTYTSSQGDSRD
ncbi:C40 family peptidase [Nocardia miyunensis]|uniref:C40 family peptidase n=1 Tax=Nocardia miyunensis TaxID=282684 RepID=UPI00082B9272|nr:C40 family peptidase [Nocardia miyunensis]